MLLALISNLFSACWQPAPECEPDEARCVGLVAENCREALAENDASWTWNRNDCSGGACVLQSGYAFCALDDQADAVCKHKDDQTFCDGSTRTTCYGGYVTWTHDCATGEVAGKFTGELQRLSESECSCVAN